MRPLACSANCLMKFMQAPIAINKLDAIFAAGAFKVVLFYFVLYFFFVCVCVVCHTFLLISFFLRFYFIFCIIKNLVGPLPQVQALVNKGKRKCELIKVNEIEFLIQYNVLGTGSVCIAYPHIYVYTEICTYACVYA